MNDKLLNVFAGHESVLEYLNPDEAPYTPLVELPEHLNPYRAKGVRIFAKLMNVVPLANMKSLPAYNMLMTKKLAGELVGIDTVVENSSGNTVMSLAVIARLMGIPHTKSVCSHQVSMAKLNILRLLGAEVIINQEAICPDPTDENSGIYKAKVWAEENNWLNPGQYDNQANPEAHYKWTGPQIWEQTQAKLSIVSVGLGTTGSAVGIGSYLKEQNQDLQMIGVVRAPNNEVPGPRTLNLLKEVAFDWRSEMDAVEEVGAVDSYRKSMELCRAGLLVGPSSGFALVGLLQYLSKQSLDPCQEKIAVFICPDGPFPYIDNYFEYLDDSDFPTVTNADLLTDIQRANQVSSRKGVAVQELEPRELLDLVFGLDEFELWRRLKEDNNYLPQSKYLIIDLRDGDSYAEHHLPGAVNIALAELEYFLANDNSVKAATGVVMICNHGKTSYVAAEKAVALGIEAISLKGGDVEWSRQNLPRYKADKCVKRYNL